MKIKNTGHSRLIGSREVVQARFHKKYDGHKHCAKSRAESTFRSIFHAPSQKFKILAIPDVLAHGKSYEHDFTKKLDGHIFARSRAPIRSRVSIDFSCTVSEIQNTATPDVLAHGKSYEHGFTKKCNGHKLCARSCTDSSFDRFFMHRLGNSKYCPFPKYYP
ncbi:hypothetical protein BHM03_00060895 [Ensete ventricosum]|nr:hypothetical protein BHM03_00060895 [Ensete ventricosum]